MIDRFTRLVASMVPPRESRARADTSGLFAGLDDEPEERPVAPATRTDPPLADRSALSSVGLADEGVEAAIDLQVLVAHMAYRRSLAVDGRRAKGGAFSSDL